MSHEFIVTKILLLHKNSMMVWFYPKTFFHTESKHDGLMFKWVFSDNQIYLKKIIMQSYVSSIMFLMR